MTHPHLPEGFWLHTLLLFGATLIIFAVEWMWSTLDEDVIRPAIKELKEVHERRLRLVEQALTSSNTRDWSAPMPAAGFPFESFVQMKPDGTIVVAGQTFNLDQPFEIMARDDRNNPRASLSCAGRGLILVMSHGQMFRVQFQTNQWNVQPLLYEAS